MRTRWWTPQGPGADSFDVVLADDPTVAGPFLALHRIGAAACEQAAAFPLVDPAVLAQHLGSATDLTRVLLDSWVGKSEAGAYGRLLARDLLTDARTSAQRLFAGLVSKGVAPPLAAERVGAVYGVPSVYAGRYREIASAPVVPPRVLADAADRTLFGYLARLLEVEREGVAKATATPDDPSTVRWDARTAGGQFAPRVGTAPRVTVPTSTGGQDITSWLQAQMDALDAPATEAPATEAPAPEVAKPKRAKRIERRKVVGTRSGAAKPKEKTETAGPAVAEATRKEPVRRQLDRRKVQRREQTRRKLSAVPVSRRQVERIHQAPARPTAASRQVAPDVHEPIRPHESHLYEDVDAEVSVAVDMAVAHELIENSGGNPFGGKNAPVFRAGYLTEVAGGNIVMRSGSDQLEEQITALAEQLPGAPPVVERISADDVAQWSDRQFANELDVRRRDMWFRYAPKHKRDDADGPYDEIYRTEDSATGDVLLVYDPEEAESAAPLNRVAEFRIRTPRAEIHPGRQEQIRLDPNQAYKIVRPALYNEETDSFQFGTGNEETFDTQANVWRVVYHLEPVDEDEVERARTNIENRRYPGTSQRELGKAAATPDDPATTYYDARSPSGRFTVDGQDITDWLGEQMRSQQEQPEKPPPKKIKRMQRRKVVGTRRAARPEPAPETPAEPATRRETTRIQPARREPARHEAERRDPSRRQPARRGLVRAVYGQEPMGNATTVLHANQEYAVVMPDQAQSLLATWHANLWDTRLNQTLPPRMRQDLNRAVAIGYGTEVDGKLADANLELAADAGDYLVSTTTFVASGPDDPRIKQEAAILRGLMEEGTITSAVVREIIDDDGQQKVEVESFRTRRPIAPVVLLAFDPGVTLDNATGMQAVERIRSHQLGRDYDPDEMTETNPVSLDTYVVRITGPTPSERA